MAKDMAKWRIILQKRHGNIKNFATKDMGKSRASLQKTWQNKGYYCKIHGKVRNLLGKFLHNTKTWQNPEYYRKKHGKIRNVITKDRTKSRIWRQKIGKIRNLPQSLAVRNFSVKTWQNQEYYYLHKTRQNQECYHKRYGKIRNFSVKTW